LSLPPNTALLLQTGNHTSVASFTCNLKSSQFFGPLLPPRIHSVKQQTLPDSYRKLALCKSSAYLLTFLHEVDISNCKNLLFAAMQIRLKLNTRIIDLVN